MFIYKKLYKKYCYNWKDTYMDSFKNYMNVFIKDHPYIQFKRSACGRFYVSYNDWIVIRIDRKSDKYLKIEKSLDDTMIFFDDSFYHIYTVNVYTDYKNPTFSGSVYTENYLENLKAMRT